MQLGGPSPHPFAVTRISLAVAAAHGRLVARGTIGRPLDAFARHAQAAADPRRQLAKARRVGTGGVTGRVAATEFVASTDMLEPDAGLATRAIVVEGLAVAAADRHRVVRTSLGHGSARAVAARPGSGITEGPGWAGVAIGRAAARLAGALVRKTDECSPPLAVVVPGVAITAAHGLRDLGTGRGRVDADPSTGRLRAVSGWWLAESAVGTGRRRAPATALGDRGIRAIEALEDRIERASHQTDHALDQSFCRHERRGTDAAGIGTGVAHAEARARERRAGRSELLARALANRLQAGRVAGTVTGLILRTAKNLTRPQFREGARHLADRRATEVKRIRARGGHSTQHDDHAEQTGNGRTCQAPAPPSSAAAAGVGMKRTWKT